jgi:hypothetical protein
MATKRKLSGNRLVDELYSTILSADPKRTATLWRAMTKSPESYSYAFRTVITSGRLASKDPIDGAPSGSHCIWQNNTKNVQVDPLECITASSLPDLVNVVMRAQKNRVKVKAVGSGHSWSDICETTGYLVDTHGLNKVVALDATQLHQHPRDPKMVKCECGIVIQDLNLYLESVGLALENMGGYAGQTIVGAISTGTHGSGLSLGPIASQVVSLTVVSDNGSVFQVEPKNGITDPQKFHGLEAGIPVKLVQDDDWFNSCVVGLGYAGLVYSVTLRVAEKYYLEEVREVVSWATVADELRRGDVYQQYRHFEVLVNPYKISKDYNCLTTKRNVTKENTPENTPRYRQLIPAMIAGLPLTGQTLVSVINAVPEWTPQIIDAALHLLETEPGRPYRNISYEILNLGPANNQDAYSSEYAIPIEKTIDAVNCLLTLAEKSARLGRRYHSAPIALRFVASSPRYVAMEWNRQTCTIEIPTLNGTIGGRELIADIENSLYSFDSRPHWGQLNNLNDANNRLHLMYPKLKKWLEIRQALDKQNMFGNALAERCGFLT